VSEKNLPCSEAVVQLLLGLFHKETDEAMALVVGCRRATLLFGLAVVDSPRRWLA